MNSYTSQLKYVSSNSLISVHMSSIGRVMILILCFCSLFPPKILKELGLGPEGHPIPAPVVFQVYPYPVKRMKTEPQDRFTFIAASADDMYVNTCESCTQHIHHSYIASHVHNILIIAILPVMCTTC